MALIINEIRNTMQSIIKAIQALNRLLRTFILLCSSLFASLYDLSIEETIDKVKHIIENLAF